MGVMLASTCAAPSATERAQSLTAEEQAGPAMPLEPWTRLFLQ